MPLRNIGIVYQKELTEALRDRRTLVSSLLVPLVLFPILTAGFGSVATYTIDRARREPPLIMLLGGEDSPAILDYLRKVKDIRVLPAAPDWRQQIAEKKIRAAVEIPRSLEAEVAEQKQDVVKIYVYRNQLKSELAADRLERALKRYNDKIVQQRLAAHHLSDAALSPFDVKQENVVSEEKAWGELLGGLIGYMVVLLCLTGGMYPAMDLTAGEKERGTMETILSSPVSRVDLVLGKFLLVLTAALVTSTLSVVSMAGSFAFLRMLPPADQGGDLAQGPTLMLHVGPQTILSIFIMAVPLAVLFSASLMTIAIFAKSYKEAQSYTTPLMMVVILPAVASMLPGAELNSKLALVPILNASLLCKELVAGTYHWNYIAIIFGSTCVYAALALFLCVKMFQREDVLFRS